MAINYWGVLAATVAAWIFGAVYYGVLGERWMIALGRSQADIAARRAKKVVPVGPMVISFVAELVMAFMLAGLVGHIAGGAPTIKAGLLTGGPCWLGFVVTVLATNYGYQQAKPSLTIIDSLHWLGVLLIQGIVIGAVG
ncbi:MAG: DUF1761 domain-containing protein [Hyphomicrobiales bacterium]|nr:DUF1761 domain-containing protein [Hyphomicrobiales bacterium]